MNSIVLTANVQPNLDVNYIGMDVHSDNVVVCVRRNTINSSGQLVGKTIKTKKVVIKNSQEPLVELLSKYADGQQHIMTAESTFNWYWLADIAEDHGWNFRLADPCTVSQATSRRRTTKRTRSIWQTGCARDLSRVPVFCLANCAACGI